MIWGAISAVGKSRIAWIPSRMNSSDYTEILDTELVRMLEDCVDENAIFQQDNAPIHVSARSKDWFRDRKIELLTWPARSPDLNPIENVWGILARRIYKNGRQFETVAALKDAIREEWSSLGTEEVKKLIETMPQRIFQVIRNNGGSTKY